MRIKTYFCMQSIFWAFFPFSVYINIRGSYTTAEAPVFLDSLPNVLFLGLMFVLFTLTVLYLKCFLSLIIQYFMYSWMQTNVNKKPMSLFGNVIQIKEWYNCLSFYITVCLKRYFLSPSNTASRSSHIWTEFPHKSLNLLLIYFPFLKFSGFFDKVVQLWPSLSSKF